MTIQILAKIPDNSSPEDKFDILKRNIFPSCTKWETIAFYLIVDERLNCRGGRLNERKKGIF